MKNRPIRIGEAARMLRVSIKTLHRAEREGRIKFFRKEGGGRRIWRSGVRAAHVLTLGQLSKRLKIPCSTLLRAAKQGKFPTRQNGAEGHRHASLIGVELWAEQWKARRRPR